jgi:hypothetical protein
MSTDEPTVVIPTVIKRTVMSLWLAKITICRDFNSFHKTKVKSGLI